MKLCKCGTPLSHSLDGGHGWLKDHCVRHIENDTVRTEVQKEVKIEEEEQEEWVEKEEGKCEVRVGEW